MIGRALLKRRRDGRWHLNLGEDERVLLADLADQLEALIGADPTDPGLRRLFPTAYTEDAGKEQEWQLLMGEELRAARHDQLEILRVTATRTDLDEDEVGAWMQAINALRLVLGTRLDVSEDDVDLDPDDPAAPAMALYGFLGYLLDRTVSALSGG